jgi:hypothetical protein
MGMIDRVKGILLDPKSEWPKIAAETATMQSLYTGWILILAAIGPIALVLRTLGLGIGAALLAYVISLAVVYIVAMIADMLAPSFGGGKDMMAAMKLVAYSMTAGWIGGVFQLIPVIGAVVALLASVYGFYLFYLGAPVLGKCSPDKAVGYTIVVVLCVIVLQMVLGSLLVAMMFGGGIAQGMMGM